MFAFSQHPYGHMLLVRMVDVVDDTVLVRKSVLSPLLADIASTFSSKAASKIILAILAPHDSHYFDASDLDILKAAAPSSKKDPELRRKQLLDFIKPRIMKHASAHALDMSISPTSSQVLGQMIKLWGSEAPELVESVAKACAANCGVSLSHFPMSH